jgi:hypothetical protein
VNAARTSDQSLGLAAAAGARPAEGATPIAVVSNGVSNGRENADG